MTDSSAVLLLSTNQTSIVHIIITVLTLIVVNIAMLQVAPAPSPLALSRNEPLSFPAKSNIGQAIKLLLEPRLADTLLEQYDVSAVLGQGAHGRVYRGLHRRTGTAVAIKIVRKSAQLRTRRFLDPVTRTWVCWPLEAALLSCVSHPNIVRLLDVQEDGQHYLIITECHGHKWSAGSHSTDLFECIEQRKGMSCELATRILGQILDALLYLRSRSIFHLDLKDENITVDKNFHIKIIDFGSACYLPQVSDRDFMIPFEQFRGTPQYAPPEIHCKTAFYPEKSDSWALGSILYTMIFAHMPIMNGPQEHALAMKRIQHANLTLDMKAILLAQLAYDPRQRMSFAECKQCLDHCLEKQASVSHGVDRTTLSS